jgi:RNA polymerase sigma-70 factor (ECF subfamily)
MNPASDDQSDFLKLIETNRQRILRICRVYCSASLDAEDLYQEILIQIWRGLPRLKQKEFADTWVYRVALNAAISFVRKDKPQRRFIPTEQDRLIASSDQRQSTQPDSSSELDRLYEAIAKLNVYERAIVTLYLEELSYSQIAQVMGIKAGHVGVMLHRTRNKLAELMSEVPT